MKGNMFAAAGTTILALSLLATPQARAQVAPARKEAGLGGAELALCSAYVQQICPEPENRSKPQCGALRDAFLRHSRQGAFPAGARVKLSVGNDASVAASFEEFASIFCPSSRLVPDGYGIELFAMVEQESDLHLPFRTLELFESPVWRSNSGNCSHICTWSTFPTARSSSRSHA